MSLPAVLATLLAFALTPAAGRLAMAVGAVDQPGERKVHTIPVPRLGGLAVVASITAAFATAEWTSAGRWQLPPHLVAALGFGGLPVLLISIADDIRPLPARIKLAAHIAGAAVAVALGASFGPDVHLFGS